MKYLSLLCLLSLMGACQDRSPEPYVLQGNAFGTTYAIQYYSTKELTVEKGLDSVFRVINQSVSTYLADSDISRINQGDTTVVTDTIFKEVFHISEKVYERSNKYFDPTVGILRNAYGFGDIAPITTIDSMVLDSLREFVGFHKVRLNADGTVYKKYPEIYLDFNAVAKGYGIDRVGQFLEQQGVSDYIIELGGEILANGMNLKKNQYWTAGVEAIDSELNDRSYRAVLQLNNQALASSGNYRKFRINPHTGKKYVHTINPITGLARETNVTSATVLATTCAEADAYATACMAMGFEAAKELLISTSEIEGYLTYVSKSGEHKDFITEGFRRQMKANASE